MPRNIDSKLKKALDAHAMYQQAMANPNASIADEIAACNLAVEAWEQLARNLPSLDPTAAGVGGDTPPHEEPNIRMADIVPKEAGAIESVEEIYANYNARIDNYVKSRKAWDDWLKKTKKTEKDEPDKMTELTLHAFGIETELQEETRLPPEKMQLLNMRMKKEVCNKPLWFAAYDLASSDGERYNNDPMVIMYVVSRKSMRQIAKKMGVNVSTVSRHITKWAEESAERRGSLATIREVELARLDERLEQIKNVDCMDSYKRVSAEMQILDRKYKLLGLTPASSQVVVGIGIKQGHRGREPRVIDGVAGHLPENKARIRRKQN